MRWWGVTCARSYGQYKVLAPFNALVFLKRIGEDAALGHAKVLVKGVNMLALAESVAMHLCER